MNRGHFSRTVMAKKILVSDASLQQLKKLKDSQETYDDVLQKLLQEHNKEVLKKQARNVREGKEFLYDLESF